MFVRVATILSLVCCCVVSQKPESLSPHSLQNEKLPTCKPEDIKKGQWIQGAHHCGTAAIYSHPLTEGAVSPVDPKLPKPWPFSDWCWKPYQCKMQKFSVEKFCQKLNGRSILVVGDSIQHQFYDSLYMQLETPGQPMEQWYTQNILGDPNSGSICAGKGGGRLHYIRSDHFAINNVVPWNAVQQHGAHRVTNRDWKKVAHVFDLIVLGKGPHYVPLSQSQQDSQQTADWLKNFIETRKKENNRNLYIFYRTAPTGNAHCSVDSKPNTTLLLDEPDWLPVTTPQDIALYKGDFHWDTFPAVNKIALEALNATLPSGHFIPLHVAEMSVLRPDAHRCYQRNEVCDELHYFLPSVVDNWIHAFYHFLPEK